MPEKQQEEHARGEVGRAGWEVEQARFACILRTGTGQLAAPLAFAAAAPTWS